MPLCGTHGGGEWSVANDTASNEEREDRHTDRGAEIENRSAEIESRFEELRERLKEARLEALKDPGPVAERKVEQLEKDFGRLVEDAKQKAERRRHKAVRSRA
jgi:chromosome segregation ATPase